MGRGKKTPEYNAWSGMKSRCYNQKDKSYKYYGARGIKVCDRWKDSYASFIEDLGNKPTPTHRIDRIDKKGDYDAKNCRWALPTIQNRNKGMPSNNKSGKVGVCFDKTNGMWYAHIKIRGTKVNLGRYISIDDAIKARLYAESVYWGRPM